MARTSRTEDPSGAPYRWEDHRDPRGVRVVENELDECLDGGCRTQSEYDMCRAEIQARLERAKAGQLGSEGVPAPQPVVTQPSLWEVKWSFSSSRQLRLYHAEPVAHEGLLLALKYHWKRFGGLSGDQKEAAQNAEMAEAASRFQSSIYYVAGLD